MALEQELKFFKENVEKWKPVHLGKFALVKGEELINTFDNAETAFKEGVAKFGTQPFLVRPIVAVEEEIHIPALTLGLINASFA